MGKYGRGARGAHRAPRAPAGAADGNGQERRADSARGAAARPEAVAAAPQNRTKGIATKKGFCVTLGGLTAARLSAHLRGSAT